MGVYRYIKFGWGHHPTEKVISGFTPQFDYTHCKWREKYRHEGKEALFVGKGILFLQFTDTEDADTIEVTSKYPKNVLGIKPVFQSLTDNIPKAELGLPPLVIFRGDLLSKRSKELIKTGGFDFSACTQEGNDEVAYSKAQAIFYGFGPMIPEQIQDKDFIFESTSIKLDYKAKRAALTWNQDMYHGQPWFSFSPKDEEEDESDDDIGYAGYQAKLRELRKGFREKDDKITTKEVEEIM